MSSNMERVAAMPDASLYVNRDGRCADDCVDSHGGGNLTKIPRSGGDSQKYTFGSDHQIFGSWVKSEKWESKQHSVGWRDCGV